MTTGRYFHSLGLSFLKSRVGFFQPFKPTETLSIDCGMDKSKNKLTKSRVLRG
jgi:hypothetical protein